MSVNDTYTNAEAALSRAFRGTSALCAVDCACGRTYFVSAAGHGDFEPGELEGYKAKASIDPDKYVECDGGPVQWMNGTGPEARITLRGLEYDLHSQAGNVPEGASNGR